MKTAYQDGKDFYDCETGDLVFRATTKILKDYDISGAEAARKEFMMRFVDYEMEVIS